MSTFDSSASSWLARPEGGKIRVLPPDGGWSRAGAAGAWPRETTMTSEVPGGEETVGAGRGTW